jgi:hypothetical protein
VLFAPFCGYIKFETRKLIRPDKYHHLADKIFSSDFKVQIYFNLFGSPPQADPG